MRLRSKTADLLRTPKFEEYMNEAYSDKITNAIRELFPDYKIESNQRHNVSIITIKQIWPSVQEATKKVKQRYGVD